MHSSRMPTARSLTIVGFGLGGACPGGVPAWGGVPAQGGTCLGGACPGGVPARGVPAHEGAWLGGVSYDLSHHAFDV